MQSSICKDDNNYMTGYGSNKELSHLMNWDVNKLYGWAMLQKLPFKGFKWRKDKFRSDNEFIQIYNEDSLKGYTLEVDVQFPKKLYKLHIDLLPLPKKNKN